MPAGEPGFSGFTPSPNSHAPRDWEDNENARPHVPKQLRPAFSNHVYVPPSGPQQPGRYQRVPYAHQEYPKMLYHPRFGSEAAPVKDDFRNDREHNVAMRKWQKGPSNRTKTAQSEKEEKRLTSKGWLAKRPEVPVEVAQIDSDEI